MATTFLSDQVISSTELRNNQKHWFDKASENVVTVINGRKQFALIDRERISKLYAQKYYSELVIKYCQELEKKAKSDAFPWAKYLNDEEKSEFHNSLLTSVMNAVITEDWLPMEHLIEDWKATAEANSNPDIRKALLAKEDPTKYASIRD